MICLDKLYLKNYRCYLEKTFHFNSGFNVIVGNNAVGKTSIVEALYCLGFGKSFKTKSDKELINYNAEFALIKGLFMPNNVEVSLAISENKKKIKKNGIEYKQLSEHLGFLNIVMFTPEDLDLIKGSPAQRRSFLDINLALINKSYLQSLIKYKRLLKQRNEVLKDFKDKYNIEYLDIITEALVQEAIIIVDARERFISSLKPIVLDRLAILSNSYEQLDIVYKPSCNVDKMWKTYKDRQTYDIFAQTTTIGPHRDDFLVYINNKEVSTFGSQGQQRSASLSIKLGFAELLNKEKGSVMVILDDVFSELDDSRQNKIFKLVKDYDQIFITTTSIDSLHNDVKNNCKIINI